MTVNAESHEQALARWRATPPYVECAGVRVPLQVTTTELEDALRRRKWRFTNETEIVNAFLEIKQKRRNE